MELREYRKEDSGIICGWIRDKEALYCWSADRIGKFPLEENDLQKHYEPFLAGGRFIPLTAVDGDGRVMGHLLIRYPDEGDDTTVRFGFVILDPALRGRGLGKAMLGLAVRYARERLHASRITLGVFSRNVSARHCYEAAGFRATGEVVRCPVPGGEWECVEMVFAPAEGF